MVRFLPCIRENPCCVYTRVTWRLWSPFAPAGSPSDRLPGHVRMSRINQLALSDVIERALTDDVLAPGGWPTVVADHPDDDQVAVDAVVYRLAHALGGQKPAATVAIARGLALASGPKRAAHARQAGLIPPAEPGKASGRPLEPSR
jgi:hypothetical protein